MSDIKPATVTTTLNGEVIGFEECRPDSYVLVTGPDLYVAHETVHGNGTYVITVKRVPPSPEAAQ